MPSNPIKSAPVVSVTAVESVVTFAITELVTHHVISVGFAATWGPILALVLPVLFGAVKWQNVSPFVKVQALAGKLAAEIADAQHDPAVQAVEAAVLAGVTPEAPSAQAGAPDVPAPQPAKLVEGTLAPEQTPAVPEQPPAAPEAPSLGTTA